MDVIASAKKHVEKLKKSVAQHGLFSTDIIKKNYNYEFTVSRDSVNLKILVYFGKKGVRTVLQGNQTNPLYKQIEKIAGIEPVLFEETAAPDFTTPDEYIGSDESGKGDFFGPLVTAAFCTDKEINRELLSLGVKDSKTLSENSIKKIAFEIEHNFPDNYAVSILLPKEYNKLYKNINNINTILSAEHIKVIQNLFDKVGRKEVIIDQFSVRTQNMKQQLGDNINFITKAEKFPAVAAASILARNRFSDWFDNEPALSLNLPKGASRMVEEHAAAIKNSLGLDIFNEIAKVHFSTFNKIQ